MECSVRAKNAPVTQSGEKYPMLNLSGATHFSVSMQLPFFWFNSAHCLFIQLLFSVINTLSETDIELQVSRISGVTYFTVNFSMDSGKFYSKLCPLQNIVRSFCLVSLITL